MVWFVLACVAMGTMTLSAVVQFVCWMEEGTSGVSEQTIDKTRFLARTLLVAAILLQSAVTMHIVVRAP